MNKANWIWMPHAAHLIVGQDCRFHLATYVGKWIVSTVGEYLPDSNVREVLAESRGLDLQGRGDERRHDWMKKNGYEEIGFNRKYETMVFKAQRRPKKELAKDGTTCCPWEQQSGTEVDMVGYNTPERAYLGHLKMCAKWARKGVA